MQLKLALCASFPLRPLPALDPSRLRLVSAFLPGCSARALDRFFARLGSVYSARDMEHRVLASPRECAVSLASSDRIFTMAMPSRHRVGRDRTGGERDKIEFINFFPRRTSYHNAAHERYI